MVSIKDYLSLSALAYVDFESVDKGKTIGSLADSVRDGAISRKEFNINKPELSALADPNSPLRSYTLIDFQPNTSTGFVGVAFQDPETKEIIFAFRGTELGSNGFVNMLKDVDTDLNIAFGEEAHSSTQFDHAFSFWQSTLKKVGKENYSGYSFTGHSLGGGLAQYMTYKTNEAGRSVTFNAVGIGQAISGVNPSDYNDSITDYVNENDAIGMYGIQLGQTKYIKDNGNWQVNSQVDIFQLALKTAVLGAM